MGVVVVLFLELLGLVVVAVAGQAAAMEALVRQTRVAVLVGKTLLALPVTLVQAVAAL